MHLKVIQQLSRVPRSVGVPPLSDANFEQALTTSANNLLMMQQQQQGSSGSSSNAIASGSGTSQSNGTLNAPSPFNFQFMTDSSDDDGRINPLAGMGLSDEQYSALLQNLVNGDGFLGMMNTMNSPTPSGSSSTVVGGSEKRPLEDPDDDREGKRSRFEVLE